MQPASSVGVSVVDQRLMALLEQLDTGLRQAGVVETFAGVSRSEQPRRKLGGGSAAAAQRVHNTFSTLDRTVAVIVVAWLASIGGSSLFGSGSGVASWAATAQGPRSVIASWLASRSSGLPALGSLTDPYGDGISVEEFERQVRRLLAERRKQTQRAGVASGETADYPVEPAYVFPLGKREPFPEPLAPPATPKRKS